MNLLLDTHLLLWAANTPEKLSPAARAWIENPRNALFFSVASIWEIAIKAARGRRDFQADGRRLREDLILNSYSELVITSEHALAIPGLPRLHKDPFDRILVAQATVECLTLLTADAQMAAYGSPVRLV